MENIGFIKKKTIPFLRI